MNGATQRRVFVDAGLDTRHLLVLDDVHTGLSAVWVEAENAHAAPLRLSPGSTTMVFQVLATDLD